KDRACRQGICLLREPPPEAGTRRLALKLDPGPIVTAAGQGYLLSRVIGLPTNDIFLPAELEYAITSNLSVVGLLAPLLTVSGAGLAYGLIGGAGARLFPFLEAFRGPWIGFYAAGVLLSQEPLAFDLRAQLGYSWVFDNGFTIGVGADVSTRAVLAQR